MRINKNRSRRATPADLFQNLAVCHLRKTAAAKFFGRSHSEHPDSTKAVDHFARNIGLSIDRAGVELLIQKLPNLSERFVRFDLLRRGNARVRHHPIRDKMTEKKAFSETDRLWTGKEQLLRLLNFFLSLCFSLSH